MNAVSRLAGEEEVVTVFKSTGLQFTDIQDDKSGEESLIDGNDNDDNDDGNSDSAVEGTDLLCESGSIASQGSVTVENGLDGSLNVRSLGLDDICFDGEIGRWDKSWIYSPTVNAVDIRGGNTKMGTQANEKVGFHAIITFFDKAEPLEVPEEYDRSLVCWMDWYAGRQITWEAQGVG